MDKASSYVTTDYPKEKKRFSAKEVTLGIFSLLFWFAGCIGTMRFFAFFINLLPISADSIDLLVWPLGIVVPCIFGIIIHSGEQKQQAALDAYHLQVSALEDSIERAVVTGNVAELYGQCDPGWIRHIQEVKAQAADQRAYQEYLDSLSECTPPADPQ